MVKFGMNLKMCLTSKISELGCKNIKYQFLNLKYITIIINHFNLFSLKIKNRKTSEIVPPYRKPSHLRNLIKII